MQAASDSLTVQDVLSVFSDLDRSERAPVRLVLVELLTADGLLILKMPPLIARELMESLARAAEELEDRE